MAWLPICLIFNLITKIIITISALLSILTFNFETLSHLFNQVSSSLILNFIIYFPEIKNATLIYLWYFEVVQG